MNQRLVVGALGVLLAACGGAGASQTRATAKPVQCDDAAPSAMMASTSSGGEDASSPRSDAADRQQLMAPAATPDDLGMHVIGPSPIGEIDPGRVGEYAMQVEIQNQADHAIALDHVSAVVTIYRADDPVPICSSRESVHVGAPELVAPDESITVPVHLPCALTRAGDYEAAISVVVGNDASSDDDGDGEGDARDIEGTTTMPLHIDATSPPSGSPPESMAPAPSRSGGPARVPGTILD